MYLQNARDGAILSTGYIPTAAGRPITVLDGWLWVIVSSSSEQQAAALRFLNWMSSPERQVAYHDAIRMLPATRAGQRQLDLEYATFLDPMLENAVILPGEMTGGTTARALQNAFVSVINGQSTAADALTAVLDQLGQ
jgi:ABC-type glycerol-3-phosphate transport system substrate-binding protein